MRNPIRLKNLRVRFVPFYLAGGVLLWLARPDPPAYAIGLAAVVAGAALRTWGAGHLVKTDRLTIAGPYAHLRHPLYLGTLLVATGFAAMVGSWISLVALAAFLPWFFLRYFPRKEEAEARRLAARYGAAFEAYRAAVPALLPRLRPWSPPPETRASADADGGWSLDHYSANNELGTLLALVACVALFGLRAWRVI